MLHHSCVRSSCASRCAITTSRVIRNDDDHAPSESFRADGSRMDLLLRPLLERIENLIMLGESAVLLFAAVDQVAIGAHIEDAATAFDQLCFDAEFIFDCIRQTGGSRLVVSHSAVFDADLHGTCLLRLGAMLGRSCSLLQGIMTSRTTAPRHQLPSRLSPQGRASGRAWRSRVGSCEARTRPTSRGNGSPLRMQANHLHAMNRMA